MNKIGNGKNQIDEGKSTKLGQQRVGLVTRAQVTALTKIIAVLESEWRAAFTA